MAVIYVLLIAISCSMQRKLKQIENISEKSLLSLSDEVKVAELQPVETRSDTLKVSDETGREILIMKAIKNEAGEMVATDVINAAKVTAKFRNIAERNGKIELRFDVDIPKEMLDSKWQIRLQPILSIKGKNDMLDKIIITGKDYRLKQVRGYEQYEKFIASISADSLKFIDINQLEIFLKRNLPQIYSLKKDSSFVSDEKFSSYYGITEKAAIKHYTNYMIVRRNKRKISKKAQMYAKLVKNPIISEGLRLDSIVTNINGDIKYSYIQTLNVNENIRKAEIRLSGDIYNINSKIYEIPKSSPLTFYISSLSSLIDKKERFITKIIERRATTNTAYYIDFGASGYDIDPDLGNNRSELKRIMDKFRDLNGNNIYSIDSIIVIASCSPEGNYPFNLRLSRKRAKTIASYFSNFLKDSINFSSKNIAENWPMLEALVNKDTSLNRADKESFFSKSIVTDYDKREVSMHNEPYYKYIRTKLYPKLRTVCFDIHLHRKGMIRDTIHTTEIDTIYANGVKAIIAHDYKRAVSILRPYKDFNTAVAFLTAGYDESAMSVLSSIKKDEKVEYLLAILYSRFGNKNKAVEYYLRACKKNRNYINRGNLDPEISALIQEYKLNLYN
jgi:hypothetical protein